MHDRFFFALFATLRFSVNLGILERPLALGFIWALFTGDWETSLGVAVFFELFWLDLLPVGTYVPPHSLAATLCSLALIDYFHATGPGQFALPLLLSLPVALFGSRLEFNLRKFQDVLYNSLLRRARRAATSNKPFEPGRLISIALLQGAVANFIFFTLSLGLLVWVMGVLNTHVIKGTHFTLEWGHLWFLAAIGGILSLRVQRAFAALAVGVGGVILLNLF